MTTLELAEAIAMAVIAHADEISDPEWRDGRTFKRCAEVVLDTLREHQSWFCRVSDPEDGVTVETPYEQIDLF